MGRVFISVLLLLVSLTFLGKGVYLQGKAWLAQALIENAWQDSLKSGEQLRPWPWADTYVEARLSVPELNVERFVLAGASGRNLAFGPAHLAASTPLAEAGSAVIAGHNDSHFAFLKNLMPGMQIELETKSGQRVSYRVQSLSIARENETGMLMQPGLYLVTCYPFDGLVSGSDLRAVFRAVPVSSSSSITTSSA